jgi:hypothetical protein
MYPSFSPCECICLPYCNADCQKNHWPEHKKICKQCAAELHDEALFKDPPWYGISIIVLLLWIIVHLN